MKAIILNIACSLIAALIGWILGIGFKNRKKIKIWFQTRILIRKEVRFSTSYLFRIKIDDKYLLIEGDNINQLQPIGGVYKYYSSFKHKFNQWNMKDDRKISKKESSKQDLRVTIPSKYALEFINWFESRKNREVSIFREFNEEVLKEIPDKFSLFAEDFKSEYIRTHITPLRFSKYFQCYEILIADIFELELSREQENALKQLIGNSSRFILVNEEDIKNHSINKKGKSYPIGENTTWTI